MATLSKEISNRTSKISGCELYLNSRRPSFKWLQNILSAFFFYYASWENGCMTWNKERKYPALHSSLWFSAMQVHCQRQRPKRGAALHFYLACRSPRSVTFCSPRPPPSPSLPSFGVLFTSHTLLSLSWCFCQLEPGGHPSSRFVLSLSALGFSLRQYLTYYFRRGGGRCGWGVV